MVRRAQIVEEPSGAHIHGYLPSTTHIQCAGAFCSTSAIARVKTRNGWAPMCLVHYDAYWLDYAKRWNANPEVVKAEDEKIHGQSYRERLYAERKLPYQPPSLAPCAGFRCVGTIIPKLRQREPGEDPIEDAA